MVRRPSERVQALAFVAVLIVAIAGLYASVQRMQPASVPSALVRDAALDVRGNGWSVAYRAFATVNNTVFGLLLEASAALRFSVQYQVYQLPQGVLVTAINGTSNGEHGRFWQYWVNGQCGTVAADRQPIGSSDRVLWNFTVITCG